MLGQLAVSVAVRRLLLFPDASVIETITVVPLDIGATEIFWLAPAATVSVSNNVPPTAIAALVSLVDAVLSNVAATA